MKRLAIVVLLVAAATRPAFGQALVAAYNSPNSGAVASQATVFTGAVGAGDWIGCAIRVALTTDSITVSDNINGSWTASVSAANSTNFNFQLFYKENSGSAGASGLTVTASVSPTNTAIATQCIEFSGTATTSSLDGTPSTNPVTTSATSITGAAYSSSQTDTLFAFLATGANVTAVTAGASYTVPSGGSHTRGGVEYQLAVAAGSQTPSISWTTSTTATMIVGGVLPPAAGGTCKGDLMLLGAGC